MRKIVIILLLLAAVIQSTFSWGKVAHQYINKNATIHLPSTMQQFIAQSVYFGDHASDADYRKDDDPTEVPKHYLDMENYPNYKLWIPRDLDSILQKYGKTFVDDNGIVPWATVWAVDSLTARLKRGDWSAAYAVAADIGHYVGDAHQPLHATNNYNGYLTGNNGIHSRYESTMISKNQTQLFVVKDSVRYIDNVLEFVFQYLYESNSLTDSIMAADTYAKTFSGWSGSGSAPDSYYTALWSRCQYFTKKQIQSATVALASLWYTAHINAGLISKPASVRKEKSIKPKSFNLYQNFPNPFNPKTKIEFDIAETTVAQLGVFSVDGKLIAELVNSTLDAGSYSTEWDAKNSPSGLYFYRLHAGEFSETKKLVIVK